MKPLKMLVAPALFLAMAVSAMAGEWMTDYNAALALSKKTGKPILADFTGSDWCGWCIKLKNEVFTKPEFKTWAKNNVILLELDYPRSKPQPAKVKSQNVGLAKKYQIEGYPTILFLNSSGKVLATYGYDSGGPKAWTKKAEAMLKGKKG